jgi:hypothetical protein
MTMSTAILLGRSASAAGTPSAGGVQPGAPINGWACAPGSSVVADDQLIAASDRIAASPHRRSHAGLLNSIGGVEP